ncbi:MAG: mannose-6-phosphate isomerase, class I [Desulfobacterales bacterium]|nr:mannose-6-phosphate isomerase, class I [Desulfobacterales bacterium]
MRTIGLLENTIQEYEWGSYNAIANLFGKKAPSDVPQAELWMGAHPKASSKVVCDGQLISLHELILKQPEVILGERIAGCYNNQLPFLFKVLAASRPLSIQAHPNLTQAKEGFNRENDQNISKNAPNRNYKDNNHKPECICALTPFWALNGFRKIEDITTYIQKICPNRLGKKINTLKKQDTDGLKHFFEYLMTLDQKEKNQVIDEAVNNAQKYVKMNPVFEWILTLSKEYPNDIGLLSPAMLNLICLEPGEALFIFSGELHGYLSGMGIELMANSDNVLRGGLTPKHVDVPELLKVVNFKQRDIKILQCEKKYSNECIYPSKAKEFVLSVISLDSKENYKSPTKRSAEILLCTDGQAIITEGENDENISLIKGKSVFVPASVKTYSMKGKAVIYKASVNSVYGL